MRHRKHRNQLGVKKEHREALLANLSMALIQHGRIKTTLKKAKALRPFIERIITLAKKGTLHHRRIAIARVRDVGTVHTLFDEKAEQFADRNGGYTRIYKIGTRRGDAAEMALIELIAAEDEGYGKKASKPKKKAAAKPVAEKPEETTAPEAEAETPAPEAEASAASPDADEGKKEDEAK